MMLHPETKIKWMDVEKEFVENSSILNLFVQFAHRMNSNDEIVFDPGEIKITDWRGWTDIQKIRKIKRDPSNTQHKWMILGVANKGLILTGDTILPVYVGQNPQPKKGFHGASVFPYWVLTASNVNFIENITMRVRDGIMNDTHEEIEFAKPHIVENLNQENWGDHGFEILVKSRFFNAQDIHLFGSDEIPDKQEVSR